MRKAEKVRNELRILGKTAIRPTGKSMEPTIYGGELIEIINKTNLETGDIVLIDGMEMLYLHRIHAISGDTLFTKGDALSCYDLPVQKSQVIGVAKVDTKEPNVELTEKFAINAASHLIYNDISSTLDKFLIPYTVGESFCKDDGNIHLGFCTNIFGQEFSLSQLSSWFTKGLRVIIHFGFNISMDATLREGFKDKSDFHGIIGINAPCMHHILDEKELVSLLVGGLLSINQDIHKKTRQGDL